MSVIHLRSIHHGRGWHSLHRNTSEGAGVRSFHQVRILKGSREGLGNNSSVGLSHVLICCKMCGRKRREGKQKPTLGQMVRDEGENFQPRAWYLLTQ